MASAVQAMIRIHFPKLEQHPHRPTVFFADAAQRRPVAPHESRPYSEELRRVFEDHFRVSSAEQADLFVYPFEYHNGEETTRVAAEASDRNLPCVFFAEDESAPPATPPNGVVFRHSTFGAQRTFREQAMPSWHPDLYTEIDFPLLELPSAPTVGFCGFVGTPLSRTAYRLAFRKQKVEGLVLRRNVLRSLAQSPRIEDDFILRRRYWGEASLSGLSDNSKGLQDIRSEYLETLRNNAYTVAIRGKGNHSVRFFETLSAGRIPLFVNTDCVLPLSHCIDYSQHCIQVEIAEVDTIAELTLGYHQRLSETQFQELQVDNRRLWFNNLRPAAFFQAIFQDILDGVIPT